MCKSEIFAETINPVSQETEIPASRILSSDKDTETVDARYLLVRLFMRACNLNTGITYSNIRNRETVMVIALTSSPEEFQNSFDHEKGHLCRHISRAFGPKKG